MVLLEKLRVNLYGEFARQRERLVLWAPGFLGAGIALYFSLPAEPPLWPGLFFMGVLIACLVLARGLAFVRGGCFLLFLVALGFCSAQVRAIAVYTPILAKEIKVSQVTGTIESVEDLPGEQGKRILLYDVTVEKLPPERTPVKLRLTVKKEDELKPGMRGAFLAHLNPPSPPVAPGAFDFQRYLYFQQIGGVGFIFKVLNLSQNIQSPLAHGIENLRNAIAARIGAAVSKNEAPMSIAFVTGQRAAITKADNTAMQNAGLSHLISISGLHIGLFSAFIFFTVRLFLACIPGMALRHPIKKYAAILAFLGACFYTMLAGASIPTDRSLITIGIAYVAILLDRSPMSLRLLACAAFLLLLVAPESLITASFQMSFAAVAALIIVFDALRPWIAKMQAQAGFFRRALFYVGSVCLTTIVATLATAPFSLFHFQQLAVYGVLGNALAVPLTSFIIMPAIILMLVLMPMHLDFMPVWALEQGMRLLLDVAHYVAALPHALIHVEAWPTSALLLVVGGLFFLGLWNGYLRFLGVIPILCAFIFIAQERQPDILVSSDFALAAYQTDDVLHASTKRKNKFILASWERMAGLPEGSSIQWPKEGVDGPMSCDRGACRLELKQQKISFLNVPEFMGEECGWANVIISFKPLKFSRCPSRIVIDKFDGLRNGAYALWLGPQKIEITNAQEKRGIRFWSDNKILQ
jgi:competence protein ComEC